MKFTISRTALLDPLGYITSVVERRQTLPILSNVHLKQNANTLALTATDLEVEVMATIEGQGEDGELTVGARKLLDICRALPEGAALNLRQEAERAVIQSGRSRFLLQTLPADDFPRIEPDSWAQELTVSQAAFKGLFDRIGFAMAQQDVRYYLNGALLDVQGSMLCGVATDGHRLAKTELTLPAVVAEHTQIIVPRKAVQELSRLLANSDDPAHIQINPNHMRVNFAGIQFTTKLIDGRYPDYQMVMPTEIKTRLMLDHGQFRDTLSRASILTNDKFRGVRLTISQNSLRAVTNNPDQEEAFDEMPVEYDGEELDVGFNVAYLMEALNVLEGEQVEFALKDQNSSCILREPGNEKTYYLVMPMRL